VTRDEAKRIAALYRPGAPELADPEMAEALELARIDAELRAWFEEHSASQSAIRDAFRAIKPPEGLEAQILSERIRTGREASWRKPVRLAAATALVLAIVILITEWSGRPSAGKDLNFSSYRSRMVGTALRLYGMDMETNDLPAIRGYLQAKQALADFTLPQGLGTATATGCGVLTWQGNRVSMVCFKTGRPLKPGQVTDLYLFVINRSAAPGAPAGAAPKFAPENRLMTASWTEGDLLFLLATEGDEEALRQYF
jgi:hypothetical protein